MEDETVLVRVRLRGVPPPGRTPPDSGVPVDPVELAATALWAEGATAVEVRDDPDGTTLLAGFPTPEAARSVAGRLGGSLDATAEAVTDTGWRDAWKAWVQPVPVGEGLMVVPAWRTVTVESGRISLEIDPGPCFGSGTHPSTRMLLAWLDRHRPAGADVLDVGTGSGILAVAAAVLGARSVTAVDIDPAAVSVTEANAARNGVQSKIAASTTPVAEVPDASADLVMVNVTAATHAAIAAACSRKVRAGGTLLVAGLLPGQWQHVAGAYTGLTGAPRLELDGWEGAVLRPDDAADRR